MAARKLQSVDEAAKRASRQIMAGILRLFLAALPLVGGNRAKLLRQNANQVEVTFENPYPEARELFWIGTEEPVSMGVLDASGGSMNMNSYHGHTFGWRLAAHGDQECTSDLLEGRVTVARGMERHVLGEAPVVKDLDVEKRESERNDPFEAKFVNRAQVPMTLTNVETGESRVVPANDEMKMMVERGKLYDWRDEETGELLYRSVIEFYKQTTHVFKEEKHTRLCAESTPATTPVVNKTYADAYDGRDLEVQVLSEDPFIAYMPEWTLGDECADMEGQARKIGMSDAQVFGERTVIADRRAISANLNWSDRNKTSVNNRLINRAFEFARVQRRYKLDTGSFQEPLNFIQYAVAGEYRPHCDGVCNRKPYARGGRVATLIHYCKAADVGGGTVFPKANIKVQPRDGSAVLFAYKRDDGYMDDGNTMHTGCLVREGYKQIVTMWMREDVTPREPWSDFMS